MSGKLTVPTVFFDSDLLTILAKRYDPITNWVKNNSGVNIFKVFAELIREVFILNPNHALHEKIDMGEIQEKYEAQATYLRIGSLQEHATKIGTLSIITANTPEPLFRRHFHTRTQALYFSLCKIFGMDETMQISGSFVFIMAQTLQFGMSTILDYGTFLAQEIHNGLVGIAQGK